MAEKTIANILGYRLTYLDRTCVYHAELPSSIAETEDYYTPSAIDAWRRYITALDAYAVERIRRSEKGK